MLEKVIQIEEVEPYYQSRSPEEQSAFEEWLRLYELMVHDPSREEELGAIVVPTGDRLIRIDAGLRLFISRFDEHIRKPSLVVTGESGVIQCPISLIVTDYALPRFVSTCIKTVINHEGEDVQTRMYGMPTYGDWFAVRPKEGDSVLLADLITNEIDKIHEYRLKGDVATEDEVRNYMEWLRTG